MKSLKLHKMTGAGNSFLVLDDHYYSLMLERSSFAKKICSLHHGVGADGVLFIKQDTEKNKFIWDFYNSDGSVAEMCGNAARCAALYVSKLMSGDTGPEMTFSTLAGNIKAQLVGENIVKVYMPQIKDMGSLVVSNGDREHSILAYNTGVPHAVVFVDSILETSSYGGLIKQLRHHNFFGKAGTNITFVQRVSPMKVKAVTFERGVEGFTLACGTGAVAAARAELSMADSQNISSVLVEMPGGTLTVEFIKPEVPVMIGEAHFICEISLYEEVFNESI